MDLLLDPAKSNVTFLLSLLYSTALLWTEIVEFVRHVEKPDVFRIWFAETLSGRDPNSRQETVANVKNDRVIVVIVMRRTL